MYCLEKSFLKKQSNFGCFLLFSFDLNYSEDYCVFCFLVFSKITFSVSAYWEN